MNGLAELIPHLSWASLLTAVLCVYQARRYGLNPYLWGVLGFIFGLETLIALYLTRRFRSTAAATANQKQAAAVIPTPSSEATIVPALHDPRLLGWYYVDRTRQPVGPMSLEELAHMFRQDTLASDSLVWHPELADWSEASRVPILGTFLEPAHSPTSVTSSLH